MWCSRWCRAVWMYCLRGCGAFWAVIQHSAQQLTSVLQQKMGLESSIGEPSTWLLCLKSSPLFSKKDVSWCQENHRTFSLISLVHWEVKNLKYPWISLKKCFLVLFELPPAQHCCSERKNSKQKANKQRRDHCEKIQVLCKPSEYQVCNQRWGVDEKIKSVWIPQLHPGMLCLSTDSFPALTAYVLEG